MELLRPAFGDEPDLPCRRSPVFRSVARRQNLDLIDGFHVLCAKHRARRTRAGRNRAVHHDDILIVPRAIDAEAAVADAVGVERADRAAANAGFQ